MKTRTYKQTVTALFEILYQANMAGSGGDDEQAWQSHRDAMQTGTLIPAWSQDGPLNAELKRDKGLYGHINDAIREIAGQEIIDHWNDTFEVDMNLANRT